MALVDVRGGGGCNFGNFLHHWCSWQDKCMYQHHRLGLENECVGKFGNKICSRAGACALAGDWPRLPQGGLGDTCGSVLVGSMFVAIIRPGPSGKSVLTVLGSVRLKRSRY